MVASELGQGCDILPDMGGTLALLRVDTMIKSRSCGDNPALQTVMSLNFAADNQLMNLSL